MTRAIESWQTHCQFSAANWLRYSAKKTPATKNKMKKCWQQKEFQVKECHERSRRKMTTWILEWPRVNIMINKQTAWKLPTPSSHGSNQLILKMSNVSLSFYLLISMLPSKETANNYESMRARKLNFSFRLEKVKQDCSIDICQRLDSIWFIFSVVFFFLFISKTKKNNKNHRTIKQEAQH